jgi:hypothetical protein
MIAIEFRVEIGFAVYLCSYLTWRVGRTPKVSSGEAVANR